MKKLFVVMGLMAALMSPAVSMAEMPLIDLQTTIAMMDAQNVIDWKVGETATFDVSMGFFGKMGTNVKSVTKDEGTALWLHQDMNLSIQQQKVDALISKADGKILKLIVNGKEEAIPNDPVEVISQDYAEITVPAGTFQAIHIIAKTKQVSKLEVWANPRDTVMEGTLKQIAATQFGDMVMELTSFKKAQ